MSDKLRVAVFGVGSLGQHHARVYSELQDVDLVGVYDVNPGRAAEVAGRVGTRPFDNMDALAAETDAASVAVPTDRHYDTYLQLAGHDLHLLVEKPIAATTAEAETMVRLAREKQLILQVGHIERFNPVMEFLEKNLAQPQFIEAIRMGPYPPPREEGPPRGTEVSVVLDLMIHDLEIILHLVRSPVQDIRAFGMPVFSPGEDIADVRLCFENGCVANLTASRISDQRMRLITVYQEDSYVSLDYANQAGVLHRKGPDGMQAVDVPVTKGDQLTGELQAFVECVRTRSEPRVTGEQASNALKLAADICTRIATRPS